MAVPILKQGDDLIVTLQAELSDQELSQLREQLADRVGRQRARGLLIDVSALDVMDSYAARTLTGIAHVAKLRGADVVLSGIQPDVAFSMVQLGITLEGVDTELDLDEGLAALRRRRAARVAKGEPRKRTKGRS
jgi:rsbT antagonist protein RsbS